MKMPHSPSEGFLQNIHPKSSQGHCVPTSSTDQGAPGCMEGGRSTLEECSSHPCREGQVKAPEQESHGCWDKCPGIFQS